MIQQQNGKGTWLAHARTLPAEARIMGLYLLGASRSGKSRMLGRVIAWQDFIAERGQVIFDPRGVTIGNFLDKLVRYLQYVPKEQHYKYWRRIRYVEVSGKDGAITGLPLYYRLTPEETLAEISERFLQLTLRSNPHMADAQYFGWPPFHRFGLNTGILCASLGLQITDIASLISHPEQWLTRFSEAAARNPEAIPACDFFRTEYLPMRPAARERLTNAFRDKLVQFSHDPLLSYQFGARVPGIDWEEVEAESLTVLLDFRRETNPDLRRFKLLWLFDYLFNYIKIRGRRTHPLALLIDEFAAMTQKVFTGENPLAVELNEFIQEYLRNNNIWLTVAHQSVEQLDEQLRNTLFSLGTYIFGRVPLPEARIFADVLFPKDVFRVKHHRKVWGKLDLLPDRYPYSYRYSDYADELRLLMPKYPYYVLDTEPEFMSLEEQQEEAAVQLAKLGVYQFLCRPAIQEGVVSSSVIPLSIADVDRDEETGELSFPNQAVVAQIRSLLEQTAGMPSKMLLAEQDALVPKDKQQKLPRPQPPGTAPASPQQPADGAATPHPPLPPRRHRIR